MRSQANNQIEDLNREMEGFGTSPIAIPDHAFSDQLVAQSYLRRLDGELAKAEQLRKARLADSVARLRMECQELGIPAPEQLEGVTSPSELEALERVVGPQLNAERVFVALTDNRRDSLDRLICLPLESRLRLYDRALNTGQAPALLLEALLWDKEAARKAPNGHQLLASAIRGRLESGEGLPAGTWQVLGGLYGDLTQLVVLTRLDGYLTRCSEATLDLEGLASTMATIPDDIAAPLRWTLRRIQLRSQPIGKRVEGLAQLAMESDRQADTLRELLSTLLDAERYREGILLAAFLIRVGISGASDRYISDALLICLLETEDPPEGARDVAKVVLAEIGSLATESDDIVVLLYLTIKYGFDSMSTDLQYQKAKELEALARRRPALLRGWIMPMLATPPETAFDQAAVADVQTARKALDDWNHAMQKNSCYIAWPTATDYQRHFRAILEEAMDAVRIGRPRPAVTPEHLIDQVASANRITRAQGKARRAMLKFIDEQLQRLELVEQLTSKYGGMHILESKATATTKCSKHELEAELESLPATPALAKLYAIALGSKEWKSENS